MPQYLKDLIATRMKEQMDAIAEQDMSENDKVMKKVGLKLADFFKKRREELGLHRQSIVKLTTGNEFGRQQPRLSAKQAKIMKANYKQVGKLIRSAQTEEEKVRLLDQFFDMKSEEIYGK